MRTRVPLIVMLGRALATFYVQQRGRQVSPTPALHWRRGLRSSSCFPPGAWHPRRQPGKVFLRPRRRVCTLSPAAAATFGALARDEPATTPIVVAPPTPYPGFLQGSDGPSVRDGLH